MLPAQPHLLHPMKSTRVPRRFVFLDTEAHRERKGGQEEQRWRLGVTAALHWQSKEHQWSRPTWADHETPEALWSAVVDEARKDARTVVVAHNLAYDLRIAQGLEVLARWGFHPEKLVVAPEHVAMDMVRDDLRLVLVDSTNVLPVSIERLGELLEQPKPALPAEEDSQEAWFTRCRADVGILMRAYLAVVDDLRTNDLGCWARTGSGIGWNTLLRRFLTDKVLVHSNDEVRTLEHEAAYAGRCEAWRHGRLKEGPFTEWDHALAYANVLADETLPAYLLDLTHAPSLAHVRRTYPRYRWLVHARVDAPTPTLPARDEHGVYWPTGTHEGWWWDVEILMAADEGARVEVLEAYRYAGAPWLATWASWVLDRCADDSTPEAKVLAVAAKHWQRAVVGRTAMRWRDWQECGPAYTTGVSYLPLHDLGSGASGAAFQLGGRRWETWERTWADSALPQLHSAVMAHCRVRLWQDMRTAGLEHVVYVDSDALITDVWGTLAIEGALARGELGSLRAKATIKSLTVHAPRYVTSPTYSRIAGVPRRRNRTGAHTYTAETWESLTQALSSGRTGTVMIRPVTVTMGTEDWRRVHLADGTTQAYGVAAGVRTAVTGEAAAG